MAVKRIKPNILSSDVEGSRAFYTGVIGLEGGPGLDWIMFFGTEQREVQLSVMALDIKAHQHPDVSIETRIVHGPAARVLLDVSEGSDLLVISRRRLGISPFGRLGAVGHDLLRLSDVPVHVVPYTADPSAETEPLVLEEAGAPLK